MDQHLFGTSRWDNLSDSDEERERELESRVTRMRSEQVDFDFDAGHALQSSTLKPKPKRHSGASVAPKQPKQRALVTVIPPPWAADHAAAAASASASQGGPAFTDRPYTGPEAPLAIRRDARPSQLFARAFGTYLLGVIWLIEALNYCVHVIFRPEPWNAVSVVTGYALWAVQLASLARCPRRTCTTGVRCMHTACTLRIKRAPCTMRRLLPSNMHGTHCKTPRAACWAAFCAA